MANFIGVFLLASIIGLCSGHPRIINGRRRGGSLGKLPVPPDTDLPKGQFFTQYLDHFNDADIRTWQQQYFVNYTYYKHGGPVFLLLGGEAAVSATWAVNGQWITRYAKKFNAVCFLLEHRFYGKSRPTADLSNDNLKYLSSEQSLADAAYFIAFKKKQLNLKTNKWITFGGSYSGSLSAWFRMKYPHLADGAVATSAPVEAILDFKDFLKVTVESLNTGGSDCVPNVQAASDMVDTLMATLVGRDTLRQQFRLCEDIEFTYGGVGNFYVTLTGNFVQVVQYNKDNLAFAVRSSTFANADQEVLTVQLKEVSQYLAKEERRAGLETKREPIENGKATNDHLSEGEVWLDIAVNTKLSIHQFSRCKAVISKLHDDCQRVATSNSDINDKTRKCNEHVKKLLELDGQSHSLKQSPKKTQDLFDELMKNIERLVLSKQRVLARESENNTEGGKILRQCRDWADGRCAVLSNIENNSKSLLKSEDEYARKSAGIEDAKSKTSMLYGLKCLQRELQRYVGLERDVTDKHIVEIRRRHLQKRMNAYSHTGFRHTADLVDKLQTEENKEEAVELKAVVEEMTKEYDDCLSAVRDLERKAIPTGDIQISPRDKPGMTPNPAAKTMLKHQEDKSLLVKMKSMIIEYEKMKLDEGNASIKYRAEFLKKKRHMETVLRSKDDEIHKLELQVTETEAEKEKYRRLYEGTKISLGKHPQAQPSKTQ